MDTRVKNILRGLGAASIHVTTKILIPMFIFRNILEDAIILTVNLGYTKERVDLIMFWLIAFGSITAALSFAKASSPKHSTRKAIFEIILLIASGFYLYMYRFSGALDIMITMDLDLVTTRFYLSFTKMVYISMGIIGINILIGLYDLIITFVAPIEEEL